MLDCGLGPLGKGTRRGCSEEWKRVKVQKPWDLQSAWVNNNIELDLLGHHPAVLLEGSVSNFHLHNQIALWAKCLKRTNFWAAFSGPLVFQKEGNHWGGVFVYWQYQGQYWEQSCTDCSQPQAIRGIRVQVVHDQLAQSAQALLFVQSCSVQIVLERTFGKCNFSHARAW